MIRSALAPRLRRYQHLLKIRAWLLGSGCEYRPLYDRRGFHCTVCRCGESAHRSLFWRWMHSWGLVP